MSLGQSISYAASGYYEGTNGDDEIVAIGFGGNIVAKDGNDNIWLGSIAANVYAGGGNDTVNGGAAALKIYDNGGNLSVNGVAAYSKIRKYDSGNVSFNGAAGYSEIILREGNYEEPEPNLWQQTWGQIGSAIDVGVDAVVSFVNDIGAAFSTLVNTWESGFNDLVNGDVGGFAYAFFVQGPKDFFNAVGSAIGFSSSSSWVDYQYGSSWSKSVPIDQNSMQDWEWADEADLDGQKIWMNDYKSKDTHMVEREITIWGNTFSISVPEYYTMDLDLQVRLDKLLFGGSYNSNGVFRESSSWTVPGADYAGYDTKTYNYRVRQESCSWWGLSCSTSTKETGDRTAIVLFEGRDEYYEHIGIDTGWTPPDLTEVLQGVADSFSSFLAGDGDDHTEFLRRATASILTGKDYADVSEADLGYSGTNVAADTMLDQFVQKYLPEDFREAIIESFVAADALTYLQDWAANSAGNHSWITVRLAEFAATNIDKGLSHRLDLFQGDTAVNEIDYDNRVASYLRSEDGLALRRQVYEEAYLNDLKHFESITGVSLGETLGYMGIDISDTAVSTTAVSDALVSLLKTYRTYEVAGQTMTAQELANAAVNDTTSLWTWFGDDYAELDTDDAETRMLYNQERIDIIASFVKRSVVDTTALMLDMMATAEAKYGTAPDAALFETYKAGYESLAGANIVTNGSFETHGQLDHNSWGLLSSVAGWNASQNYIEIQENGTAVEGDALVELDASSNATIYQNVTTRAGQWYTLTFEYSPRTSSAGSNAMEVWWEGELLDTIVDDDVGWRTCRYRVQADDTSSRLAFAGAGVSDGYGALLDDVSLSEGINFIDYMINTALTENNTVGTALESRWDDFVDNELVDMAAASDALDALSAASAPQAGFINFTGDYYTNLDSGFTGIGAITETQLMNAAADANFAFSRKETQINYTDQGWGPSNDYFLVHWQGYFVAEKTGTHYFKTQADDGTFLKVDGNALINDWRNHGIVSRTGSVTLEAGRRYAVEMYYYEKTGGEDCVLEWSTDQANWESTIHSEEEVSGSDMARVLEAYNNKYLETLVAEAAGDSNVLSELMDAFAASLDSHDGQIGVRLGGESYLGNPNYAIYADGELVAAGEVTWAVPSSASGSAGSMLDTPSAWQTVWFDYAGTPSTITVKMTNDKFGGTSSTDRNLWVDKVYLNGDMTEAVEFGSKDINSNGSAKTLTLVEPDLAPDVEYSDYREGDTYGNINYNGAAGYNTISHEFDFGDINFNGVSGYNDLTNTGSSGDIEFNGVSGGNVIENKVSGDGNIEFNGVGMYNEIVRTGDTGDVTANLGGAWNTITHEVNSGDLEVIAVGGYQKIRRTGTGTSDVVMAGAANAYSDDGKSDLDIYGFGGTNVVTRTGGTGTGDTDAVLGGGANVLKIDNAGGDVDAQMYGGANVFEYEGDGHTDLIMGGAANVAVVGDGGSNITAFGGANVITTGDGRDDITSFGLANIINTGGTPAGNRDHVEAFGAYTQIDYSSDLGDGSTPEVDGFSLITENVSEDDRSIEVESLSAGDSQILTDYGINDPTAQTVNNSENSDLGIGITEIEAGTGELSDEDREELASQDIDTSQMESDAQARQDGLNTDYEVSDYVNDDGTAVYDYSAAAEEFDVNDHFDEDHENAIAARDSEDLQQASKDDPAYGEETEDASSSAGPIILDMNGNGELDLTTLSTDIMVDMDGDGDLEATGWVGTNDNNIADGILVHDNDNDPDNVTADEFVFAGSSNKSDMEAAAEDYDLNNDSKLTGSELNDFYVWQDHNTDGKVDAGEVNSASALNITSIDLDTSHENGASTINGNEVIRTNEFTMNGANYTAGDVAFNTVSSEGWELVDAGFSGIGAYDNTFLLVGLACILESGAADDIVIALNAYNQIDSGAGNDLIIAGALANYIDAGAGDDIVIAGGLGNYIDLGAGNDIAVASGFGNVINAGSGNDTIVGLPSILSPFVSANVVIKTGDGNLNAFLAGLANVIYNEGDGDVTAVMLGLGNLLHKTGDGDVIAVLAGGVNSVSQKGSVEGDEFIVIMAGALNVSTHIGRGDYYAVMLGSTNVSTNILHGSATSTEVVVMGGTYNVHTTVGETSDSYYVMLGTGNVLTKVAPDNDGSTLAIMGGSLNIATLVTDGAVTGIFLGGQNIVTRVGSKGSDGDFFGLFLGAVNIATNIADGNDFIIMGAYYGNVYTKVGDGDTIAIVIGQGNIISKVGDGDNYVFMGAVYGNAFTHVGHGNTMAIMAAINTSASANVFTKVGDGDTLALLFANPSSSAKATANVMTQIGNGRTYALAVGKFNAMVKVGHGDYDYGWGTDPVNGSGLTDTMQDNNENFTSDVIGVVEDGVDHLSPVLANPYFNTVMVGYGADNIMVEVNTAKFLSGYTGDDGNAIDPLTFEEKETTTFQAAIANKGVGNLMGKFGDGAYFGVAITIGAKDKLKDYQAAQQWLVKSQTEAVAPDILNDAMEKVDSFSASDYASATLSGNININVGDGDAMFFQYGVNNIAVKVGDGGDKIVQIGDNNMHIRVGDAGNTPWAFDVNGYSAAEGAMLMYGKYNVNVQYGDSNDIIVATMPYGGDEVSWEYKGIEGGPSLFSLTEIAQLATIGTTTKRLDKNFLSKGMNIYDAVGASFAGTDNVMLDKYTTGALDDSKTKTDAFKEMWQYALDGAKASANIIHAGAGSDIIMVNGGLNLVFADNASSIVDMSIASLLPAEMQWLSLDDIVSIFTRGKFDFDTTTGKYTSNGQMTGGQQVTEKFLLMFNVFQEMGGDFGLFVPADDIGSVCGFTYNNDGTMNEDFDAQGFAAWWADMIFAEFKFTDWSMVNSLATQGITSVVDGLGNAFSTQTLDDAASEYFGIQSYADAIEDMSLDAFKDAATYDFARAWGNIPAISALPNIGYLASVFSNIDEIATLLWDDASDDIVDYFTKELGLLTDDGDVIVAKGEANFIFGGHGDDLTIAYGAFNRIYGGYDNDITLSVGNYNCIQSNGGTDISLSWGHQNMQFGGGDADVMIAYGKRNYLRGDGGDDVIVGVGDFNQVSGGSGHDVIITIGDGNLIFAGGGNDFIFTYGKDNTFYMGDGNDTLINIGSANTVYWGGGGDVGLMVNGDFYGEAGDDYLLMSKDNVSTESDGGADNDTIVMNGTCASVTGAGGTDTYVLGYEAQINSLTADTEDILFLGDMVGYGTSFITSTNIDDWLTFEKDGGELVITMKDFNGGNDARLVVEDFFALGANYRPDVVLAYWASDASALNTTRDNAETNGDDMFSYDYDSIYVSGEDLFDQVCDHESGNNIDWASIVQTGVQNLAGSPADGTGLMYAGTDAGETMDGSSGSDVLYGMAGNDTLYGNGGNDVLSGGEGTDTYYISMAQGDDTIDNTGRETDNDSIVFQGADIVKEDLWFTQSDDDLVIGFVGHDGTITIDDWYVESNGTTNNRVAGLSIEDTGAVIDADGVDALAQAMASVIASYGDDVTGSDYTGSNPNTDDSSLTSLIATTWA